jgi:beta-lactamase class A
LGRALRTAALAAGEIRSLALRGFRPALLLAAVGLAASCAGSESEVAAPSESSPARLQATLDRLAAELAWRSPGTRAALAVVDLRSGARAAGGGDVPFVSASSAKAWWVAAALRHAGVAAVAPHADLVFVESDNGATGRVIDLLGPDRINEYIWSVVGMRSTAITRWNYEGKRQAKSSPRRMGDDNYTTARDALRFLERLQRGQILDRERTDVLLAWMRRSPRGGLGGWLLGRLPRAARASAAHKAGWLEPGCCSDQRRYNTLNEVGLVSVPGGGAYAVVILSHAGRDYWGRQVPFVEYASCEIYRTVAADGALDCSRPGDPEPP